MISSDCAELDPGSSSVELTLEPPSQLLHYNVALHPEPKWWSKTHSGHLREWCLEFPWTPARCGSWKRVPCQAAVAMVLQSQRRELGDSGRQCPAWAVRIRMWDGD